MLTSEFARAMALAESGRAAEAIPILRRIVERWPSYSVAHAVLGKALATVGDAEDAFASWCRAEALAPFAPAVREGLADSTAAMFEESAPEGEPAWLDSSSQEAESDYTDAEADPTFFVPIAKPAGDEPPDWSDGEPISVGDSEDGIVDDEPATGADKERPVWDGEPFAPDSGDGSSADVDVDIESADSDVELDRLIGELETARIVPREDPENVPSPDLSDDIEDVVSETLARIYATQRQYGEAARVYDRLALENPDRADEYQDKAAEMRRNLAT